MTRADGPQSYSLPGRISISWLVFSSRVPYPPRPSPTLSLSPTRPRYFLGSSVSAVSSPGGWNSPPSPLFDSFLLCFLSSSKTFPSFFEAYRHCMLAFRIRNEPRIPPTPLPSLRLSLPRRCLFFLFLSYLALSFLSALLHSFQGYFRRIIAPHFSKRSSLHAAFSLAGAFPRSFFLSPPRLHDSLCSQLGPVISSQSDDDHDP